MDLSLLTRKSDTEWWIEPHGRMRVPGIIYASEALVRDMDAKVYEQVDERRDAARNRDGPRTRCPTRTGAMGFRSAASPHSMPIAAASCRPAASASTSPAACACCTPG